MEKSCSLNKPAIYDKLVFAMLHIEVGRRAKAFVMMYRGC